MKYLLLVLIFVVIASCSSGDNLGPGTNIGQGDLRTQLTNELDKAEIPYKIDSNGVVRYNEKYQIIVQALTIYILQEQEREKERKFGFKFADDINPVSFFAYLNREGINTESLVLNREDHAVYWKEEDDIKMQEYLMSFLEEYRDWQNKQESQNAL